MSTVPQKSQVSSRQLIDTQISATRRALKLVDLFAGLLTLIIGLLVFLFIAALFEHWIVSGGWSLTARSVLFSLLMISVGWYGWRTFWPLLQKPINPVYAAQTLEKNSPTLKNSLLSLLQFRTHRQHLSLSVYQTIEQQAAARLSQIPVDTAVDRTVVLRLGYVLVVVVATFALYCLLSPKNPIISASRVLFPWSSIRVPSRVQITDIRPGEVSVARGDRLTVAASVHGMGIDEQTVLYYQTRTNKDSAARSEPLSIPMLRPKSAASMSLERQCQLPDTSHDGVEQDIDYWIEAGDARSATYQVHVFARPTMVVKRVRYDYPAYTGYLTKEVDTTGDLDALEGTRVTLFGLSNQPIQKAFVDFNADGRQDLSMQIVGDQNIRDQVQAHFPLTLRSDRRTPSHVSYVLRFTTTTGQTNRQPPKYRIAVTPDYAPEIRLIEPGKGVSVETPSQPVDGPLIDGQVIDGPLTVKVEASDPDFALSEVRIVGHLEQAGVNPQENPSAETVRLNQILLANNHTGRYLGLTVFTLGQLNLHEGDVLVYWAEARDNRTPEANVSVTLPRRVRVIRPQSSEQRDSRQPENPQEQAEDQTSEGSSPEEADDNGKNRQPGRQSQDIDTGNNEEGGESGASGGSANGDNGYNEGNEENEANEDSEDSEDSVNGGGANGNHSTGSESDQPNGTEQVNSTGENGASSEKMGNQQPQESTADEQGSALEKVSSEGDDDGTAFDRLLEHLAEQEANQEPTQEQDGEYQSTGESGEKSPEQGEAGAGDSQAGDSQTSPSTNGESQPTGASGEKSPEQGEAGAGDGQAEDSQIDPPENGESQSTGASGEKSPDQGEAGAGDGQSDQQTAPGSEQGRKPSDKQIDSKAGDHPDDQQAPTVARDQRESDSQGGQNGDRSGGGDRGAGQQADSEGSGSAGQHQAADEGSGQSEQPGAGQTGSRPGDTHSSGDNQGASGDNQGASGDNQGASGDNQGVSGDNQGVSGDNQGVSGDNQGVSDSPGNSSGTSPAANGGQSKQPSTNEATPSESTNSSDQSDANIPPQDSPAQGSPSAQGGGGNGRSSGAVPPGPKQEAAAGDAANLDYARQQTDLVLNRLSDQFKRRQVDQKMLDKLGWTQEELRQFLQRWKNLKSLAAGTDDQAQSAQTELDASLRSLGLRKDRRMGYDSNRIKDNQRDLRDTYRSRVPAALVERMRSYVKGTARGEQQESRGLEP